MELRQLRYFLSVADCRSFVSAANSLYISRQAVSKAISQLEEELGVELFVRDSSGAYLTPTGLMFYERIRTTVMELDSIAEQIRTGGSRYRQRIRVGFSIGTLRLLERQLQEYRDTLKNTEITYAEYPEAECIRLLTEHRMDLVVSTCQSQNPLLTSEELYRSRLGLLLRSQDQLAELDLLDAEDLAWIPLSGHTDSQLCGFCEAHGLTMQYQGFDYHRLFTLAKEGKCGLLLPECLIPQDLTGTTWIPLREGSWCLYRTYPQMAEKNPLYSAVLDDLDQQVLQHVGD